MNDSRDSYFFAYAMLRLRGLITGEFWATEHDRFDLHAAAMLARLAG